MLNNMLYSKKIAIYDTNKRVKMPICYIAKIYIAKILLYSMLYSKNNYAIYDTNKRVKK